MRSRIYILAALLIVSLELPVLAQNIEVRAVDGKSGKPLADVRLLLWAFDTMSERMMPSGQQLDLQTDSKGVAIIPAEMIKKSYLQLWVDFHHQCVDRPNLVSFEVSEIRTTGVTEQNNCSKKVAAEPAPYTLTIYARYPTLKERKGW